MKRGGKRLQLLKEIFIFFSLLLAVSYALNAFRAPHPTDISPARLRGETLQDLPVGEILRGKGPLLLHFWGTWCPVCRREADNLQRVAGRYRVLTVAVNSGSSEEIRHWMKERGLDYPVLSDPTGRWAKRFDVTLYPSSFIYDASGKLRFVETGYTTTLGLLARLKLAE